MDKAQNRWWLVRKEIEGMMAIVIKGDALQPDSIRKAFDQIEEVDAVVSTIGGTPADPQADSQVCIYKSTQQWDGVMHVRGCKHAFIMICHRLCHTQSLTLASSKTAFCVFC